MRTTHVCEENCIWFDAYGGCSDCPYVEDVIEGMEDD